MGLSQINVGTVANDGTGDTVRAAFQKVNANNTKTSLLQHPGYVVNSWYQTCPGQSTPGATIATNVGKFIPFIAETDVTISALGVRVTSVGTTNFQLAIYASDATTKRPTGPALSSTTSTVNTSATTLSVPLPSNLSLTGGVLYWFAICQGDSTGVYCSFNQGLTTFQWMIGSSTEATLLATVGSSNFSYLSTPLTFGTWSDVTAATWTEGVNNQMAMIVFKVASIP